MDKKLFQYRAFSNVILIIMLFFISFIIFNSYSTFAFTFANDEVIYNGNRNSNKISLMINVYWGSEYIVDILNILDRFDVKTTFFVGGQWVEKEQNLFKEIILHGHEIGNHGFFHCDHSKLDYANNLDEIKTNHNLVKTFGIDMKLFAPPSGAFNKSTIKSAVDLGYSVIMWSKDTIDWRDKDANLIFTRATNKVKGGELILMHPTSQTVKALPSILEYYKLNNLTVATVSKTLS